MLRLDALEMQMDGAALRADMTLRAGERVAVIGPSGAGKSTLLDAIAGFRALRAGRVLWQGRDLTALAPQARPVSILFQDGNLFPHLDLVRNLGLALRPDGRRLDTAERVKVDEALERVGLGAYGGRRPGTLSGGQQSRAALARVLLQARPILLLDEPFAALGPALRLEMLDLVQEIGDRLGALTMLVSHEAEAARRFAERTVLVSEGEASPPVETAALFADPPASLRDYLGS